ncbi:MAG: trypsin-like peptidase domain-containing protein, partial [Nitrososphaerales archaeon]
MSEEDEVRELLPLMLGSVCRIIGVSAGIDPFSPGVRQASVGSGFLMDGNKIITCWHVIKLSQNIGCVFPTGSKYRLQIQESSPTLDLAVLSPW